MYKGYAKQNTKKELKETLNWTSSTEISSTERTDAHSIGASDGCRKIWRPALVQDWAPLKIKWRKKWSTGWTDDVKSSIGALNVLCSRDDVKCPEAKSVLTCTWDGTCRFNWDTWITGWIRLSYVTNMAPFMPFRVILVIEWQRNQWD